MKFINLTPHEIRVVRPDGGTAVFPPSGQVARCTEKSVQRAEVSHQGVTIPLVGKEFGEGVGLPDPEEDSLLIVSALVRTAAPGRSDLVTFGDLVRNEAGQPIGCSSLVCN